MILLRGIQSILVQRNWGSTVKMVFSYKMFTFYEANKLMALPNAWRRSVILLRGIQSILVQRYWGSTVKMVFSYKMFTFYEANKLMALPNAWRRSVRALS
jgi:hypothetical protein